MSIPLKSNPNCTWNDDGDIQTIPYNGSYITKKCVRVNCGKGGITNAVGPNLIQCAEGQEPAPLLRDKDCKAKCQSKIKMFCHYDDDGNAIKIPYGETYTTKNCSKMTCNNGQVHGVGPPLVQIVCKDGEVQQPLTKDHGCEVKCGSGSGKNNIYEHFKSESSGKKSKKNRSSSKKKLKKIDISGDGKKNHTVIDTDGDGEINTIFPTKILKRLKKRCSSRSKKGCMNVKKCTWIKKKKKCVKNSCFKKNKQNCRKGGKCKWVNKSKKCQRK